VEFKLFLADFGRMLSTEVVDISQGGMSFSLPMGAKSILSLDKRFRDCPIKINGQLFSVDVKLRNLFYQEGKLKVGVSFECPPPYFMTEVQLLIKRGQVK
jgi:c-di-GMP-binding flagellar brake protein YcgR